MAGFRQALICGRDASTSIKATGGGTYTGAASTVYKVRVTTAGASGAAKVTVYDINGTLINAAAAVTSGSAITLGAVGATLTLTWSGVDLVVGQEWWAYADTGVNTVGKVEEISAANGNALRPAFVNSSGELLVKPSTLTLRDYTATISGTTPATVTFTGSAHAFTVYNGDDAPIEVSIDGTNYNLIIQAYGDSAGLYLPPGGYLNAAGRATIKVRGTVGGQSGTVTVAAWEV